MNQDREHLRLLSIFHFVMAGFACLLPLLSLIYIGMGVMILSGKMPASPPSSAHADQIGGFIFVGVGSVFFLGGVVGAILNIVAGRALAKQERRSLCFVVAGLNCLHLPLGTLLGVFTLVVLARPSVKLLFEKSPEAAGQSPGPGYPPGTSPFSNPNQ